MWFKKYPRAGQRENQSPGFLWLFSFLLDVWLTVWYITWSPTSKWETAFQNTSRDFPGSPVVNTLHFHCRGHASNPPGGGTKIPHSVLPKQNKTEQNTSRTMLLKTHTGTSATGFPGCLLKCRVRSPIPPLGCIWISGRRAYNVYGIDNAFFQTLKHSCRICVEWYSQWRTELSSACSVSVSPQQESW